MMDSLIHSNPPSRLEDTNPFPGKFKKLAGRPEEAMGEENTYGTTMMRIETGVKSSLTYFYNSVNSKSKSANVNKVKS